MTQRQDKKSNTYLLDPEGRTAETSTVNAQLESSTKISHYAGESGTPSWTYDETTGHWTRSILGFVALVAVQEEGKEAVLQLTNLEGDVVGTASLSESATKPLTMERSTEYGVPTSSKPADKYNWLGAAGLSSELPSGAVVQDGETYVPQIGAPLQSQGESIAPEALTAVPFVVTASPTRYADDEPWVRTTESETPGGNVPEPGGEQGKIEYGPNKSKRRIIPCYTKVMVGEEKGWVYARAWAWCPGVTMPAAAYLQAGLLITPIATGAEDGEEAELEWGDAVDGEEYPHQLYAHVHEACGSGIIYYGWARFALDSGGNDELYYARSKHGWHCGENITESTAEFLLTLLEQAEIGAPPD